MRFILLVFEFIIENYKLRNQNQNIIGMQIKN